MQTFTLPAHWASALINNDYSGLTDEDEINLRQWLQSESFPQIVACEGEYFSRWHDAAQVMPKGCLVSEYTAI